MISARSAAALKAGDLLTVDGAPGLRLVATDKFKTWTYRYRSPVDARMRQIRLGRWPAMGIPAAMAAWQKVRAQRDAGNDPAQDKRQRRREAAGQASDSRYTVRVACEEYMAAYSGTVTPKTYAEAARIFSGELMPIADKPAASITRADAFDLLDGMRSRPVIAGRLRQLLGAVWDRSLDAGRLAPEVPNWWRLVLRGKMPSKGKIVAGKHQGEVKRVLSDAELAALLPWFPNWTRDIEDALTLYLWTCCRGAEIMAMERQEISEEDDGLWWTVPRAKLKMRRNPLTIDLRVPLIGRAEAVVRRRLAATDKALLFHSRGRTGHVEQKAVGVAVWVHMPACTIRKEWVRPRLPVVGWAPHDLRRTGRTLLAALGCPSEIAEAILGHLQPGVQGTYNRHGYDPERRRWLTLLAQHLEQLAGQGLAPGR